MGMVFLFWKDYSLPTKVKRRWDCQFSVIYREVGFTGDHTFTRRSQNELDRVIKLANKWDNLKEQLGKERDQGEAQDDSYDETEVDSN